MKKLLGLLGSLSLVASSSSFAVACTNTNNKVNEEVSFLLSQVAKSAYLEKTKQYNINETFTDNVDGKKISDLKSNIEITNTYDEYTRFNDIQEKYFDSKIINDDIEFNYEKNDKTSNGLIKQISSMGKLLFSFLSNPETSLPSIINMISKVEIIKSFLTEDITKYLGSILSDDAIKELSDSFNDSYYEGYTYQQVIDSSIIGISNAVSSFSGIDSKIDFKSKDNLVKNNNEAIENIGNIISDFIKGEIKLNFDILSNLSGLFELIRSLKLIVNYVSNFDLSKSQTFSDIKIKRESIFESKVLDFKKIISQLSNAVNSDNGQGIQGLIQILFATNEGGKVGKLPIWIVMNWGKEELAQSYKVPLGFSNLIFSITNKMIEPIIIDNPNLKIFVGHAIIEIINIVSSNIKPSIKNLLDGLSSYISGDMKNMILKIQKYFDDNDSSFNLFKSVYSGELLPEILGNDFLIKNLKSVFELPINNFISNDMLKSFEDKSIKEILDFLNTELSDAKDIKIDPNKIKAFADSLLVKQKWTNLEGVEQNTTLFQHFVKEPSKAFEIFGLEVKDGKPSFKADSPLEWIEKIIKDITGLETVFEIMDGLFKDETNTETIDTVKKAFNSLKINSYNVKKQNYTFNFDNGSILFELDSLSGNKKKISKIIFE